MLKTEQEHLMKLHKMTQRLATQQDIALTLTNPLEKYLTQVISNQGHSYLLFLFHIKGSVCEKRGRS